MNKINKGDNVIVIAGKDKGKKGIVLTVVKESKKLIIDGINTVKKHTKANPNIGENGGILIKHQPIDGSNVMLYDQVSEKGSRVGIRTLEDGRKVRYFKVSNELVDV
jgi:large subunit ribosomal protein L24